MQMRRHILTVLVTRASFSSIQRQLQRQPGAFLNSTMSNRALNFDYSRAKRKNRWSTEELRRLRQLAEQGTSLDCIATALRRSPSAIRNKAAMHGISMRQATHSCDRTLPSEQLTPAYAIFNSAKGTVC